MKHIISIRDFKREEIDEMVNEAQGIMVPLAKKRQKEGILEERLKKPKVIFFFLEPSTRTLGSYSEAVRLLGWEKEVFHPEASSMKKKESFANTTRMLTLQGANILVMRTKEEGAPRFAAEILDREGYEVSVHNAGDGANQHPTQTFLDRLTIKEVLGRLHDFTFGAVGDLKYGRTIHSLLSSFQPSDNIKVKLVSSPETSLPERFKRNLEFEESDSLEILSDCDIIYVTRIQEERFPDPREFEKVKGKYRITRNVLDFLKKDVKIMHPLPYVDEISPEIRSDPRVIIDKQAWYGIPMRMYLLSWSEEKRFEKPKEENAEKEVEEKVIKEMSFKEYEFHRKEEKKTEKYFRPIRNGTVIDHLTSGIVDKVKKVLADFLKRKEGVIHTIERVPSQKLGQKDILILENIFLPKELMAKVTLIAPQSTFNIVREERFRKIKISSFREVLGIGKCPNPYCITNHDPEAETRFKIVAVKEGIIECHYCEREFSREEIIAAI